MSDFDHFLLTRFSAVLAPGAPPASEDWLYYRLGFFVDVHGHRNLLVGGQFISLLVVT